MRDLGGVSVVTHARPGMDCKYSALSGKIGRSRLQKSGCKANARPLPRASSPIELVGRPQRSATELRENEAGEAHCLPEMPSSYVLAALFLPTGLNSTHAEHVGANMARSRETCRRIIIPR